LRVGGLLWLAPLCSSWVFYNVSRTKRCKANEYKGDMSYPPVQDGNLMAEACVFLVKLAKARGLHFAIENPKGSYIWLSCFFKQLLCWSGVACCFVSRCAFDSEPKGHRIMKVYQVCGSGPWVKRMETSCPCGDAQHRHLTESWVDATGRKRTKGNRELLQASQVYPAAMAELVIESWLSESRSPDAQHAAFQGDTSHPSSMSWARPALQDHSLQGHCFAMASPCGQVAGWAWLAPSPQKLGLSSANPHQSPKVQNPHHQPSTLHKQAASKSWATPPAQCTFKAKKQVCFREIVDRSPTAQSNGKSKKIKQITANWLAPCTSTAA
jgi:hypothetical protein